MKYMDELRNAKNLWESLWQKTKSDPVQDKRIIENELFSVRWKKLEERIIRKFGTFFRV